MTGDGPDPKSKSGPEARSAASPKRIGAGKSSFPPDAPGKSFGLNPMTERLSHGIVVTPMNNDLPTAATRVQPIARPDAPWLLADMGRGSREQSFALSEQATAQVLPFPRDGR
jgi:hypothetical protein